MYNAVVSMFGREFLTSSCESFSFRFNFCFHRIFSILVSITHAALAGASNKRHMFASCEDPSAPCASIPHAPSCRSLDDSHLHHHATRPPTRPACLHLPAPPSSSMHPQNRHLRMNRSSQVRKTCRVAAHSHALPAAHVMRLASPQIRPAVRVPASELPLLIILIDHAMQLTARCPGARSMHGGVPPVLWCVAPLIWSP